jgi:hypothetical protein
MKITFLLVLLFSSSFTWAQTSDSLVKFTRLDSISMNVEFAKDSPVLDSIQKQKIMVFLDRTNQTKLTKIALAGHTDTDGSDKYNLSLSEQRVNSVKAFIEQQRSDVNQIERNFFGEKKLLREELSEEDQQKNRRVELIVYFFVDEYRWTPCVTGRPCPDTLISLPSGILYKINLCTYNLNPSCVTIGEFLSRTQIQDAGLHTMDFEGRTLFSAGMFKYSICDSVKIKVYIPVRESCFEEGMKLYTENENRWVLSSRQDFKMEEVNRQRYYKIPLSSSGMLNLDKVGFSTPPRKIKFKSKRGVKLEQVALACDCPLAVVFGPAKNKRKRTVVLPRVCCSDPNVRIILTTKDGRSETIPYKPLTSLKHIRSIGGCKGKEKWRFLVFRKREKWIYRKYRVG